MTGINQIDGLIDAVEFRLNRQESCPNAANHAESPGGYVQWHEWAAAMKKTHDQSQCPGCGLWLIWTPKKGSATGGGSSNGLAQTK